MTQRVRKAVIPVAGLGTRFLPATKAMPKEMLTVVDKPVIQYAVEEAVAAGIEDIIFVTGSTKSAIENHFDRPYELIDTLEKKGKHDMLAKVQHILPQHVRAIYTRQGAPLGLGHAVWCAKSIVGNEPFAVLLPDDIIHSEDQTPLKAMVKRFEEANVPNVLVEDVPRERTKNYGILDVGSHSIEHGVTKVDGFVEKPQPDEAPSTLGVVGRYILTPRIFDFLEERRVGAGGEIQLTDAMDKLLGEQGFEGVLLDGHRFDCGDKVGWQMANLFFGLRDDYIGPRLEKYIGELAQNGQLKKGA